MVLYVFQKCSGSVLKSQKVDVKKLGLRGVHGGPGRFRKVQEAYGNILTTSGTQKFSWCEFIGNEQKRIEIKFSELGSPDFCPLNARFCYFRAELRIMQVKNLPGITSICLETKKLIQE